MGDIGGVIVGVFRYAYYRRVLLRSYANVSPLLCLRYREIFRVFVARTTLIWSRYFTEKEVEIRSKSYEKLEKIIGISRALHYV